MHSIKADKVHYDLASFTMLTLLELAYNGKREM